MSKRGRQPKTKKILSDDEVREIENAQAEQIKLLNQNNSVLSLKGFFV